VVDFGLLLQRTSIMRTVMKLLLKWLLVASFHIGYLFILYGTKALRFVPGPNLFKMFVWLGLSSFIAFSLYYLFLLRSGLLSVSMRRTKLVAYSAGASLLSLYCGVFLCLNTFGE
jgi:hypothetical protein